VGARTDAARAEVLAARGGLVDEVQRLEAAGRAAVDIPAKVRREPVRTAGLAAGTAFVVLGGPQRIYRRARRAIFGPAADMPKSMLPDEVEKTLRRMGPDGERVRAALEREFAAYLEEHRHDRKDRDARELATLLAANLLKPATSRLGRQMAEKLFSPDGPGFAASLEKVRSRARSAPPTPARPASSTGSSARPMAPPPRTHSSGTNPATGPAAPGSRSSPAPSAGASGGAGGAEGAGGAGQPG